MILLRALLSIFDNGEVLREWKAFNCVLGIVLCERGFIWDIRELDCGGYLKRTSGGVMCGYN